MYLVVALNAMENIRIFDNAGARGIGRVQLNCRAGFTALGLHYENNDAPLQNITAHSIDVSSAETAFKKIVALCGACLKITRAPRASESLPVNVEQKIDSGTVDRTTNPRRIFDIDAIQTDTRF